MTEFECNSEGSGFVLDVKKLNMIVEQGSSKMEIHRYIAIQVEKRREIVVRRWTNNRTEMMTRRCGWMSSQECEKRSGWH